MGKRIEINLNSQVLTAYEGDATVYTFDCVSGDSDHPTEEVEKNVPGKGVVKTISGDVVTHKVLRKVHPCYSQKYEAHMNYALFFTSDGKAIHQGVAVGLLSYLKAWTFADPFIGSHGCVRLSEDHARTLFSWAPVGTTVVIRGTTTRIVN